MVGAVIYAYLQLQQIVWPFFFQQTPEPRRIGLQQIQLAPEPL